MAKQIDFAKQLGEGSAELLGQLESALGVKGKAAVLKLIGSDPEARRLATKIIGSGSPGVVKAALNPAAAQTSTPSSNRKAKVEF